MTVSCIKFVKGDPESEPVYIKNYTFTDSLLFRETSRRQWKGYLEDLVFCWQSIPEKPLRWRKQLRKTPEESV